MNDLFFVDSNWSSNWKRNMLYDWQQNGTNPKRGQTLHVMKERERERERGSLGSETAAPVVFLAFFVVELKEFTGKNALDPELRRL